MRKNGYKITEEEKKKIEEQKKRRTKRLEKVLNQYKTKQDLNKVQDNDFNNENEINNFEGDLI